MIKTNIILNNKVWYRYLKNPNELFIATFDVKIDEVKTDNDKDQYKFEFYETTK